MGNAKGKITSKKKNNKNESAVNDANNEIDEKEFKSKLEQLEFKPHLILMGDSVLDNIAWIEDKNKRMDVEKQLNIALKLYNEAWKCKNLAVDGNTTSSLIHSLNYYKRETEKQFQPKRFKSLQLYLNDIDLQKERPIVVLSVGGNDVLGYMYHVKQLSKNVLNDMQQNEFMKSYEEILNILINECKCDVIIIFTYEPHIRFCSDHNVERKELLNIIQWGATQIFAIAEKYKLPVIDLSRTGNPYNRKHYSSVSAIEPNEIMGNFVTDLIVFVLYDFVWKMNDDRHSNIYYGQSDDGDGIKVEPNTDKTRGNYLKSKLAFHPFQKVNT